MGGARPPRPAAAGFSEADLVTLYSVGVVRPIPAGECLVPDSPDACYFVVEGPLELRATTGGGTLDLGLVRRGECLQGAGADGPPYTVTAREPSSVIELSPAAFDLLPAATQRTLGHIIASSAAKHFGALAARHAAVTGRNAGLVAALKQAEARSDRLMALPQIRQAIAEVPALPVHATGLAIKLLDDRTRADEVVESIKNDPALAGLVLKRVNSAYYGLETKVSDHYRALLLLGTATVYQLLLESAVEGVIGEGPESREIQARATLISVLAYEIALATGQENPLLASTIGLLHNIGDSIALLLRRTRPELGELLDCIASPALGAAVLAAWGLPDRVHQVVARQHQADVLLPGELDVQPAELSVLYLARVCHDVLLERVTPPEHVAAYLARLGIRESTCAAFCREVLVPALGKKVDSLPAAVRARLAR